MYKTVLILARSIKHNGYCVAGKELSTNTWLRFVGDENGKELSMEQIKYKNDFGEFPSTPLKVLKVEVSKNCPLLHQPENYLISESKWEQVKPDEYTTIPANFLDSPQNLWGDTNSVDPNEILQGKIIISQSLYLVKVSNFKPSCKVENGKPKRRIGFNYGDVYYNLPTTDPRFDDICAGNVKHNSILCVSLGELFNKMHYKIIAGVY